MNPIQQTPPKEPDVDETPVANDPLDALLTQLINGFFVLTDGQGAVSKWSEPAELLFGLHAAEGLGKPLFDTLVDHAPADAEAWRRFLEQGEAPRTRAQQNVSAIFAPDKRTCPLEMVFIPVKLDEGFDFSLFLEDLSFELPRNLMLMRMRQQHPVVVRALRGALEAEPQPWDGWRTAGTLVAFRPLDATPWVDDELAAREARRAAADQETEEMMDPDPGISGDSIADLDDAAAVVARLLSALERIEDLEKTAADLPAALEEARREAQISRDRAEAAERQVNEAREQLETVRDEIRPSEDSAADAELLARIARLEETPTVDTGEQAELQQRLERLERGRGAFATEQAELLERIAGLEQRLAASDERSELLERTAGLEQRLADESAAREEVGAATEEAEAVRLELAEKIEAAERARAEAMEAAEERLAAALAAVDERTQTDRGDLAGRVEELEKEVAQAAAALQGFEHGSEDAAAAREELRAAAEQAAEAARAEARAAAEEAAEAARTELRAEIERLQVAREEESRAITAEIEALVERADREPEQEGESAREELAAALERIEQARRESDRLREQVDNVTIEKAEAEGLAGDDRRRLEELARESAEAAQRLDAGREQGGQLGAGAAAPREEAPAARAELAELSAAGEQAATAEVEALRAESAELRAAVEALREQGSDDEALEAIRASFEERGTALEAQFAEARAQFEEREKQLAYEVSEARRQSAQMDTAVSARLAAQVAEVRRLFEEREQGLAEQVAETRKALEARDGEEQVPAEAVERIERLVLEAHEGLDLLRRADASLAERVDSLMHGSEATERLEAGLAGLRADLEAVRSTADVDERLSALAAETEDAHARAAAAEEEAKAARAEAQEVRTEAHAARKAAHEAGERIADVDRGAGAVLGQVRAVSERLDSTAATAKTAQETATAARAAVDELRAGAARVSAELEVGRADIAQAKEEALGAREQAAAAGQAAHAARDDGGRARDDAEAARSQVGGAVEGAAAAATGHPGGVEDRAAPRAESPPVAGDAAPARDDVAAVAEDAAAARAE